MSSRTLCGWLPLIAVSTIVGCNPEDAHPTEDRLQIETVAGWYYSYRAAHDGKAPSNEKEFAAFIERELKETGQTIDIQQLLTSPRDGHKYVVNYKPNSSSPHKNVSVYEREGIQGKKWLAFDNKWSEEVDDTKLQEYLARQ
jgi:hypothetical protein